MPLIVHTVRFFVGQGTKHISYFNERLVYMSTDNKQSLPAITLAAIELSTAILVPARYIHFVNVCPASFGFGVERDAVFGFLSLIFWLLIFVVSIKYLTFVMRADNAGEGGS